MKVLPSVFNGALDELFVIVLDTTGRFLRMKLIYDDSDSAAQDITMETKFDNAALDDGKCQLTGAVFFAVPADTTVIGLQIYDNDEILIEETISGGEYFPDAGTFTVNNVIVTLSGE